MARDEPDFAWETVSDIEIENSRVVELQLTSQRWQGGVWTHSLVVYQPQHVVHQDKMLLFVTGGSTGKAPGIGDRAIGAALANLCGARVAMLHQVPNQPLLDGRREDELISETWLKYLETGDTSWPLLFPMVKSATKAMDALEQFSVEQGWPRPDGFVIAGASKRGWTSWLTAATDSRIIATAPIVIDLLDFPAQMKHQLEMWGTHSEQIHAYTSKGLVPSDGQPRSQRVTKLWQMMDPIQYRQRLQMPKLLVVGANDRYWATDAMNLYWDRLEGDKYIHRVPNAGHNLGGGRMPALKTLAVFFQAVATGQQLPVLTWRASTTDEEVRLTVSSDTTPVKATLWEAFSDSLDFRDSVWQPTSMTPKDGDWVGISQRETGHHAAFAELTFSANGMLYSLATLVYCQ
ncbi:PhoPQ-activated pathogenicity-related family protein [Allorhodopirellula heiligendammensis]|uniref:PhoPQ-activated pathogenicity-related protein n=1 Tax=Allorhodopirellula heiligendammensis TaxID=2714739 RepID=A0A5C6C636_9BACT|nr:PhoPQ-activated protein PqaA family protein [Allorhodopirellula heiligendammensis]TWU18239.1 PhoPQ-activated pathogenicity-related protein [Allorhodopirellula heiligendammensis]